MEAFDTMLPVLSEHRSTEKIENFVKELHAKTTSEFVGFKAQIEKLAGFVGKKGRAFGHLAFELKLKVDHNNSTSKRANHHVASGDSPIKQRHCQTQQPSQPVKQQAN